MKWIGILAGGLAVILLGNSMAASLKEDVRLLHCIRKLFLRIERELAVRRLPTGQLLRELSEGEDFRSLPFLCEVRRQFTGQESLAVVWHRALAGQRNLLRLPEASELLRECGGILGGSSWDSQIAAISLLRERLDLLIEAAQQRAEKEGRLWRSLGVLGALLLAVLVI